MFPVVVHHGEIGLKFDNIGALDSLMDTLGVSDAPQKLVLFARAAQEAIRFLSFTTQIDSLIPLNSATQVPKTSKKNLWWCKDLN